MVLDLKVMKVSYVGEYPVICRGLVWQPREVKDLPADDALELVNTNVNFVQIDEVNE